MSPLREFILVVAALFFGGLAGAVVFATIDFAFAVIYPVFTVPAALVVGVPAFYLLRRLKQLSWLSVVFVATCTSVASAPLLGVSSTFSPRGLALFGAAGFLAGVATYAGLLFFNISLGTDTQPKAAASR